MLKFLTHNGFFMQINIPLFSFAAHVAVPALVFGAISKGRFFTELRAKGYGPEYFAASLLCGHAVSTGISLAESKLLSKYTFISASNRKIVVNVSHLFASFIGLGLMAGAHAMLHRNKA